MSERLTLRLRRITWEAPGILSLELVDPEGSALPPFGPGAHVDLKLPDGQERQYSLCGDPADLSAYRVAVREVAGGRVSRAIHRALRPGELLSVGVPRNNFPFVEAGRYLFVAGGIGITPLLPMMREASRIGRPWTLLFCTRRAAEAPFLAEARALPGGDIRLHASEEGTRLDVAAALAAPRAGTVLYCCGPERLMTAVEAATGTWPAGSVRFEWFAPRSRPEGEGSDAFDVVLAQRGITVAVPPGRSILDALTEAGVDHPRSCEQGVCGTCEARVLAGEPDHRDSLLSPEERAGGLMMLCVSRAKTPRLVLDL
ncbi:MAG: PDR/VanB family oxidoreductase [Acetobacteraceae bacterium]|nr:PDR/VanB family oxidoreductase [Acetobacteraceae bacterium]